MPKTSKVAPVTWTSSCLLMPSSPSLPHTSEPRAIALCSFAAGAALQRGVSFLPRWDAHAWAACCSYQPVPERLRRGRKGATLRRADVGRRPDAHVGIVCSHGAAPRAAHPSVYLS